MFNLYKKWWFWSGLPIGFAIGYCFLTQPKNSVDWQVVDRETSIRVLAENSKDITGLKDSTKILSGIQSRQFTPSDSPPLTIYDFKTERLCGLGGCLYGIYDGQKLLFRVLLNPDHAITTESNCLAISQKSAAKSGDKKTAVVKYCYQNNDYAQQPITYR